MSILKKMTKGAVRFLFEPSIVKVAAHIERNIKSAPTCCDKPMDYIGAHSGFYLNTQLYQCEECKRVELLHKHDWEK